MFFGNMQSFYRRNSIHNQSSSQSSKSKEQAKRIKYTSRRKTDDEADAPVCRRSFSISRNHEEIGEDCNPTNVPIIKVGMYEPETSKKSHNILKEKERALWYNSPTVVNDNSERLGPNKNNIIEKTLEIERRKSGDWGVLDPPLLLHNKQ